MQHELVKEVAHIAREWVVDELSLQRNEVCDLEDALVVASEDAHAAHKENRSPMLLARMPL